MNNFEKLPNELILEVIINIYDEDTIINLCNSSPRLRQLCVNNDAYIKRHYEKINFMKIKEQSYNCEDINHISGPILRMFERNYYRSLDKCLKDNIININCLFPYFSYYWEFLKGPNSTVELFRVINKYKPSFFQELTEKGYAQSNKKVLSFIGGATKKRSTKKRSTKRRSTKRRSTKKRFFN